MTNFVRKAVLAASAAAVFAATPAFAATPGSDSKSFTATATIVRPITLTKNNDLDFGTITLGAGLSSSVVTVGANGGSNACGANLTCTAPTVGNFTVTGVANQGFDITYTAPANLSSGSNTVAFTASTLASSSLSAAGTKSFDFGGSITVTSANPDGVYSATFPVTVAYN